MPEWNPSVKLGHAERIYRAGLQNASKMNNKAANLEYDMSLSQVEISGVESQRPLAPPCWCILGGNAEFSNSFCPTVQLDTAMLPSHRILPSDRDLLINDLQEEILNVFQECIHVPRKNMSACITQTGS